MTAGGGGGCQIVFGTGGSVEFVNREIISRAAGEVGDSNQITGAVINNEITGTEL